MIARNTEPNSLTVVPWDEIRGRWARPRRVEVPQEEGQVGACVLTRYIVQCRGFGVKKTTRAVAGLSFSQLA